MISLCFTFLDNRPFKDEKQHIQYKTRANVIFIQMRLKKNWRKMFIKECFCLKIHTQVEVSR